MAGFCFGIKGLKAYCLTLTQQGRVKSRKRGHRAVFLKKKRRKMKNPHFVVTLKPFRPCGFFCGRGHGREGDVARCTNLSGTVTDCLKTDTRRKSPVGLQINSWTVESVN